MNPTIPPNKDVIDDADELLILMQRVSDGDERAFAVLYDRTCDRIFGLLRRMLSDCTTAEEVLLESYTQAWREREHFDAARTGVLNWLIVIARRHAINRLRSMRSTRESSVPPDPSIWQGRLAACSDAEEAVKESGRSSQIRDALKQLPSEQREVVLMAYFAGMSQSEIAEWLRQPLVTVKARIHLAMTNLRSLLSQPQRQSAELEARGKYE